MKLKTDHAYEYILAFQRVYPGVSPSYRDIQKALGVSSTSIVHHLIEELRTNRILRTYSENVRGIVLADTAILTKDELESMGVSWETIEGLRNKSMEEIKNAAGREHTSNGEGY